MPSSVTAVTDAFQRKVERMPEQDRWLLFALSNWRRAVSASANVARSKKRVDRANLEHLERTYYELQELEDHLRSAYLLPLTETSPKWLTGNA